MGNQLIFSKNKGITLALIVAAALFIILGAPGLVRPEQQPLVRLAVAVGGLCGNGSLDGGEQCDDGNATDGDGCSALCTVEIIPRRDLAPRLAITKSADWVSTAPGDRVMYTVELTNTGSDACNNVIVIDLLPDSFSFADDGEDIRLWQWESLRAGGTIHLEYAVTVAADAAAGLYTNTVTAQCNRLEPISTSAEVIVIPLLIAPAPAEPMAPSPDILPSASRNTGQGVEPSVVPVNGSFESGVTGEQTVFPPTIVYYTPPTPAVQVLGQEAAEEPVVTPVIPAGPTCVACRGIKLLLLLVLIVSLGYGYFWFWRLFDARRRWLVSLLGLLVPIAASVSLVLAKACLDSRYVVLTTGNTVLCKYFFFAALGVYLGGLLVTYWVAPRPSDLPDVQ
ncbi:DUF11 domain-containing protein [Candidatus Falkowbacteria bacterium]|nr:DUF11 domain-containing protein [Candidatus Falkowbacteria bacterium]